ncbi:N-acetylneuraminate synthase [Flagellimonas sp. 2504JD1-5]
MLENKVIVIAEAGVNHNGSISLAKRLIDAAVDAGVDYVKFQTFNASKLVIKQAAKARYQIENSQYKEESQLAMLQQLELSKDMHYSLIEYCNSQKIKFLSTAFDLDSVDFLNDLNIDLFKIPSGELTNLPYLRKIGGLGKPVIISTGMADINEIEEAIAAITEAGTTLDNITVLHCNTEYPTPMEDVNLSAMHTIKKRFKIPVGYSDHTLGIEVPIAAVALGATVIEKHFTLDKFMEGPDHKASLEPHELKDMVAAIRNIERAMGDGIKRPTESEKKNKPIVRKSIVASRKINKGEVFTESNITVKRPGTGLSPMKWNEVIGTIAAKDYQEDEII